jgi:signal transduction histidine kinase
MMAKAADLAARNIRITVLVCVVLICGSFAAAAVLQMQLVQARQLDQITREQAARTTEIAAGLGERLDQYAALGAHFADGTLPAHALGIALQATAPGLNDVAILGADGTPLLALKDANASPLPANVTALARIRRTAFAQGNNLVLAFPDGNRIVALKIDPRALIGQAKLDNGAIAVAGGEVIAKGAGWGHGLLPDGLSLPSAARRVAQDGNSLITAALVPGWPLVAAATHNTARQTPWYGWLPLYLFVVIGPAVAGAWLSVIFVREFERRSSASAAIRQLREMGSHDGRLLVRLAEAERRAVESERSKTEFVAHMSHELRTPLNAIIGFSEVIAQGFFGAPGHPKYVEYARDIAEAGRGLHDKIGAVLEFANVEAGRYPINCAEIDVYAIACECANEMAGRAFSRRVSLTLDPSPPVRALADAAAVKRILGNLIANALDYTPEKGRVRVLLYRQGSKICICVRDTGLGFAPEEILDAGQAFRRFPRDGTSAGLGLGLAIAVSLAERMKGELRVASNHGAGTSAELRLPRA